MTILKVKFDETIWERMWKVFFGIEADDVRLGGYTAELPLQHRA